MINVVAVVDVDRWPPIPPVVVVAVTVIRVSAIAMMIDVQIICGPADSECRRNTPEISIVERMAVGVWVVVNRVRTRVVIVDGSRLIDDNPLRLVIRYVNDLVVDG